LSTKESTGGGNIVTRSRTAASKVSVTTPTLLDNGQGESCTSKLPEFQQASYVVTPLIKRSVGTQTEGAEMNRLVSCNLVPTKKVFVYTKNVLC
jgi:hypothetical protein